MLVKEVWYQHILVWLNWHDYFPRAISTFEFEWYCWSVLYSLCLIQPYPLAVWPLFLLPLNQYIKNLVPFLYCFQLIIFKYIVTTHLFILNSLFFVVFIQLTIIHMWFTKKKENYTQPLFQLEISRLIKKNQRFSRNYTWIFG